MMMQPKVVPIEATSINTEATLYTPTSGKRWRIVGGQVACSVAGVATLKDNTAGTTVLVVGCDVAHKMVPLSELLSRGGKGQGIFSAAANNVLTGQGINGNFYGYLLVHEE